MNITTKTAIELGNVFGVAARFWMNLESEYITSLAGIRRSRLYGIVPHDQFVSVGQSTLLHDFEDSVTAKRSHAIK